MCSRDRFHIPDTIGQAPTSLPYFVGTIHVAFLPAYSLSNRIRGLRDKAPVARDKRFYAQTRTTVGSRGYRP
jgi:hypothetical protein